MQFQPSPHSYVPPGAVPDEYLGDYGSLRDKIEGVFGKEAREARQETRKARRKARRSGKKLPKLKQKSPAKELWASEYPWTDRPTTAGQAIAYTFVGAMAYEKLAQPIAKGSRPPALYQNREWRSTILGGLQALAAVGVPGYTDVSHLKVPFANTDKYDAEFLQRAGNSRSLKAAAEFIRKEVIRNKLEDAAWNLRALIMIQPAVISANARAAGASMVLSVGGAAMGPFAAIPAAVAAQEAVHEAVLAKEVKDFQQKAEQALQKAGVRNATEAVRRQVQALQKEADEESALAEAQAQEAAVAKANTLKLAMGATALLAIGGVVWWVRRRAEEA